MAKRGGKKSSSKCPEPFNTLIDLAGGAAMAAIANKMEKKHQYRKRGKINPYRASALGISTGRLKSTEDIIRLGGFLGAMGSFDDDDEHDIPEEFLYPFDDSNEYGISQVPPHDNRFAWRLNCEDGSEYGIDPEDYETREEYNDALRIARDEAGVDYEEEDKLGEDFFSQTDGQESTTEQSLCRICRVSLLGNGENELFLTMDEYISPGDMVQVVGTEGEKGIVLSVEELSGYALSASLDQMRTVTKTQEEV